MALHELATNAVKHGALSDPEGRVAVRLNGDGDGGFDLHWVEACARPVTPPGREGFGSMILRKIIPAQLGGAAERTFGAKGLSYRLEVPGSTAGGRGA